MPGFFYAVAPGSPPGGKNFLILSSNRRVARYSPCINT